LLSADVVLADGTFVTASDSSHSDLFWALGGGGGNLGIVTSFTFRCYDIGEHGTIIGGPVLYDLAYTTEVMRWYRELLPSLPEELIGWIALLTIPRAPVPRTAVGSRGLRHRLVLPDRTTKPTRCSSRSGRTASHCL
jgi:FAD/FMN-containing dehydrogenase